MNTKFHELVSKVVIYKDSDEETAQLILNWVKTSKPIVVVKRRSK